MSSSERTDQVGVVGGGLAGLAAACTLASQGRRVVLFERNAWLGGKAAVLRRDGFRFDMGPTIMMLPSVWRKVFASAGRDLDDAVELIPLDPQWRGFYEDGSTLDLWSRREAMAQALEAFAPGADLGARYDDYLNESRELDRISREQFFWRPVGSLRDMFTLRNTFSLSFLRDVLRMRPGRTVSGLTRAQVGDARLAQMLDHFTQYVGSAPDASPAVLCGIAHMQTSEGVWYPRGGIRVLAEALIDLARDLGVELRTSTGVRRFCLEGGRLIGLETDTGERVPLAAAVCNADVVRAHQELLGEEASRRFARRRAWEPACSGVVLYLGLDRRYEHLLHHNFVFSEDGEEEFESIYRRGEPAPDPTCYVCAPAGSDAGVAPEGGEAMYVLVHTPYLRPGQDWREMFPGYRRVILDKLARCAGLTDLEERIVVEEALTPQDIHDRYGVLQGAIYGVASHGRFTGAFKPSNRSPDVQGLYFAGGAAHPGPGMPMVVMSGWIAATALLEDVPVARPRSALIRA